MGRHYYYLAASLPMLSMEEKPVLSYGQFMQMCSEQLSKKDYKELENAVFTVTEDPKSRLMKKWQGYLALVSDTLTEERMKALGWEEDGHISLPPSDQVMADRIRRCVKSMDPLEGEKEILSIYFDFLTSNSTADPFSVETLMIYALKLQILERKDSFKADKGRAEFQSLFTGLQNQFH